jgi:hypothetical protein
MNPKNLYFLMMAGWLLFSCGSRHGNSVAIRDFNASLQPFLIKAASTGIVGYDDATQYIEKHATDKELVLLGCSEQPILRAIAFREMLRRPTFDHFQVIMSHLDDTAIVSVDAGEWGSCYRMVSDVVIESAKWKTIGDKDKTVEEVITRHNYLRSAYTILRGVELQKESYYPYIREMASREREFEERELALYALAQYKKRGDVPLIKEILFGNDWRLGSSSFDLMHDFPDTAYWEVLRTYYPRRFYRSICWNHGATSPAVEFIKAVASYQTDSSARILEQILSRQPFIPCAADTFTLRGALIHSIWENKCKAYSKIMEESRETMERIRRQDSIDEAPPYLTTYPVIDTSREPVRW